jgi:predicted small lipoprotein YifL
MKLARFALLLFAFAALSACGNKGELVRPVETDASGAP